MSSQGSGLSIAQQMIQDGTMPDMPQAPPMRAVVAAASTVNPDAEAQTQQLAQRAGMGVDLTRSNPEAARQRATAADLDERELEARNPILARQLRDPNFAGVAHDDLDSLSQIEHGAGVMGRTWSEAKSVSSNISAGFLGAFKPLADAAGVAVQGTLESPKPAMDFLTGLDPDAEGLKNIWVNPRRWKVQQLTEPVMDWASSGVIQSPQQGPWWGRSLVNQIEQVPGMLAAFALTGKLGGAAAKTAGVPEAEGITGAVAPGAAVERQVVPAILGTESAQNTYAQARAKGADQKTAVLAAIESGVTNYALMGAMPGAESAETVPGALRQWAGRSAAMGSGMTLSDNAIARSYDPNRSLTEGWQQSIATMAAFEGVGAMSHVIDAVEASKLRTRSPEKFQQALDANFEGQDSLRIPSKEFVNYFDAQKLDPAVVANRLGVTNLEEAAAAGSDLEIPPANFFGKLEPEHQKGLLPDVVDPRTEMTARQAEAGKAELQEWINNGGVETLQAEYAQADAETQATPEWKSVYSDLKQRYADAGETETAADSYATMHANAIANLARKAGLKPDELLKLHNPKLTVGEAPEGARLRLNQESADEPGAGEDETLYQGEPPPTPPGASPEEGAAEGPQGTRGWFRMRPDGSYEIGKTQIGDMTTFIHEPAHAYLEMFRELTQRESASDPLKDDFKKITDWLGTTPEEAYKNGFTREQHEKWAKANEKYVSEGEAPSSGLKRAFHNFAVWMGSIYRRASALGVDLSPSVRGVMDRLYAGEDAVNRAEEEAGDRKLFSSPEEAGWTEEQYRNYADAKGLELEKARERVRAEMNEAAARERTQAWREEKSNVRDAVTEQIDARPEYTAIRVLRRGSLDNGAELTMNRDALVKQFGEERVKDLHSLHRGLDRKEGGVDPETAAEILGYGSAEKMIKALETAPRRAAAIEQATREYMTAKHGDIRYDGTLQDKARAALENDARADTLHQELAALKKRPADSKQAMRAIEIAPLDSYRKAAHQIIESKAISDLHPSRYLDASRKFSREAFDAVRRGNVKAAADAKHKELLNHFLFREASSAEVDENLKYLARHARPTVAVTKAIGADHMDRIHQLLAAFNLMPVDPGASANVDLRAWAEAEYDRTGVMPSISDDLIARMGTVSYRDMTVAQLRDLKDAVKSLAYTGRQLNRITIDGKTQAVGDLVGDVQARLADVPHTEPVDIRQDLLHAKGLDKLNARWLQLKGRLRSGDAALLKMEQFFQWLDAGKNAGVQEADVSGPMQRIFRMASTADAKEREMRSEAASAMAALHTRLIDSKIDLNDRLDVPELPRRDRGTSMYREELLAVALNMGNESNKEKLLEGYGWYEADANRAISRLLSKAELDFVQGVWDHVGSYGNEIRELQRRQTGVSPKMIEASPLSTDHGTYRGGYYPVVYDGFQDANIEEKQAANADKLFENNYARPATSKGHTIARTGYKGPMYLSLDVIPRHIDQVTHDLAWREPITDMNKVLTDSRLKTEIDQTYGREYTKQLRPWLQAMANDKVFDTSNESAWGYFLRSARSNTTIVGVGFRLSTMLVHGASAWSNSVGEIGAKWFAKGTTQFMGMDRIKDTRDFVFARSPEMAQRMARTDRNTQEVLRDIETREEGFKTISGTQKVIDGARKFACYGVAMSDMASAMPTWMGAYLKGMAKEADGGMNLSEADSIAYADRAVRNAHGGGGIKDMAQIQRDKGLVSMATMFYSFWNHMYNRQRDLGKGYAAIATGKSGTNNLPRLLARSLFYFVVPQIAHAVLKPSPSTEKDDGSLAAYMKQVGEEVGLGLFSGVPIVRDFANAVVNGRDYTITPMEQAGKAVVTTINDAEKAASGEPVSKHAATNAANAAGYVFGIPTAQPAATTKFIWDVMSGDIDPQSLSDWWQGIMTGRVK